MYRIPLSIIFSLSILHFSCTNNEIGNSKDVDPEMIYFDYKVWGDESNEEVTLLFQFRFGGPGGRTLGIEEPAGLTLDGVVVKGDSSRMTGAFYEVRRPISEFAGEHTIVFTNSNGKKYEETFSFQPMVLNTPIPQRIERDSLILELDGLAAVDFVRVLLTDTSRYSEGINRVDTVKNGRILISKQDLESLVNGPIHLELHRENDRYVENGTFEGGMLSITYRLQRQFILTGGIEPPE